MANVLTMVLDGLEMFVLTIWGLQKRRFSSAFNLLSYAVESMTTSLVLYLSTTNDHRGLVFSSPLLYIQS
ncbi:hypothetical protein TIFTF001_004633 [Ficus carica]|uniref:Uncharacterized protein n=1 Tax=Ficus carica TaxID=3494 RepID=A0AA88CY91_FICCA|nr:hypothetical protein TIFTF001_004633 [Ficus carica]